MAFSEANFSFNVDLLESTIRHLDYIKQVDDIPLLNNVNVLNRAIYRYEYFWLPLAAEHRDEVLTAPLDISWVWHCHMLCPTSYVRDCMDIVGVVVDHKFVHDEKRALQRSQDLWLKKYRDVNEPFEIDLSACSSNERKYNEISRISYDIKEASSRQSMFFYSVSLPHYRDAKFLSNSLIRYKKFLYLRQQNPEQFLVPCYDIDLIWHTHQLYPLAYKNDTESLFGRLFNHDDTANDRTPGSKRTAAQFITTELWKNTFNETFSTYGAMYRGDSSRGRLYELESSDLYDLSVKKTSLQITECVLSKSPEHYKQFKLIIICSRGNMRGSEIIQRAGNDPLAIILKKRKGTSTGNQIAWRQDDCKRLDISTRSIHNLLIALCEKAGFACWGCVELDVGGVGIYNLLPLVERPRTSSFISFETKFDLAQDLSVSLKGTVAPPISGEAIFSLESGFYKEAVIPEHLEQLWGPIKLAHLPAGIENRCQVADHRLINHTGHVIFTCRITHSVPLLMSAIQVYYHDKMVAVAHLIGSDQLPLPTQVAKTDESVVLNPRGNERAVIIKNNVGDWGICVGSWTGFRRGIPGIRAQRNRMGKRGVPGSPGTLKVSFYKMSTRRWTHLDLGYLAKNFTFKMESVQADLYQGLIEVYTNEEVAENLALVFSVSLLHVLCVPRPKNWKVGERIVSKISSQSRGVRPVYTIPSDNMSLVLACGLLWDTPSNHYIHSQYGVYACAGCGGIGENVAVCDFGDVAGQLDSANDGNDCYSGVNDGGEYGGDGNADTAGCGGCGGCGGGGGGCSGGGGGGCGGGGAGCGGGGCGGGGGGGGCGGGGGGCGGGGGGCGGGGGGCGGGGGGCGGGGGGCGG
ncbi:hypothetical protein ACJMK2_015777 [Sinanodonta woodiana]|uniref:Glycine-rich domain-containing protein 1 n=1 Tax=Sinanodonta woodiana TaxID=1069815 RepID=A0ABD3UTK7_SINWO